MKFGKLNEAELRQLLRGLEEEDPALVLGPRYGEDAGAVQVGDQLLVAASDPVTFATRSMGWYAVHINANDVAASGATPRWFLSTVLLPERADLAMADEIFNQMKEACNELSVTMLGGHTEITPGIDRPLVSGTMLGLTSTEGLVRSGGAKLGDIIVMTKGVSIEGTALLALEREKEARYVLGEQRWRQAVDLLRDPGMSVVPDARIACEVGGVHAMHDPTEGGLCTGLYELGRAASLGVEVDEDAIIVLDLSFDLCARFGIDPLRTLASGCLLICIEPERAPALLAAYQKAGIAAAAIGTMTQQDYVLKRKGLRYELIRDEKDTVTRIFQTELL